MVKSQVPDPPNYSYDPIDYDSAYGDYDYYRDNPMAIGIAPRAGFGKVGFLTMLILSILILMNLPAIMIYDLTSRAKKGRKIGDRINHQQQPPNQQLPLLLPQPRQQVLVSSYKLSFKFNIFFNNYTSTDSIESL